MRHWIFAGSVVLLLCASCSSTGPEGASQGRAGERMSFEQYPEYKVNLLSYAQVRLTAECMQKAGYPQLSQAGMPEPDRSQNYMRITAARFGPPDEAHARKYGFGYEWNTPAAPRAVVSFDAAYDKTLERCQNSTWKQIGPTAKRFYSNMLDFSNQLVTEYGQQLQARPEWTTLNQELLACLATAGYRPTVRPGGGSPGKPAKQDNSGSAGQPSARNFGVKLGLANSREERWQPTPRKGTVQIGPAIPARPYVPTREEVKFAIVYAKCNETTGRTKRLMAISQDLQDRVLRKHETEFTELMATLDGLVAKATTLIGRA